MVVDDDPNKFGMLTEKWMIICRRSCMYAFNFYNYKPKENAKHIYVGIPGKVGNFINGLATSDDFSTPLNNTAGL